jgi:hypothetical protein
VRCMYLPYLPYSLQYMHVCVYACMLELESRVLTWICSEVST